MVFYQEVTFWIGIFIILSIILIYVFIRFLIAVFKARKEKVDHHGFASEIIAKQDIQEELQKDPLILDEKIVTENDLKDNKYYVEADPYDYLVSYKYKRKWFIGKKILTKVYHKKRKQVLKKPERFVKVRFKLLNDRVVEFPVIASLIGFVFNKGKYLFDEQTKYETIQGQELIPTYDFHESLVLPIKQRLRIVKELKDYLENYDKKLKKSLMTDKIKDSLKKDARILLLLNNYEAMLKHSQEHIIPTDEIKDILESGNITETENIVNPQTLNRYLKSDFIQQLVKGTLTKLVKIMFWIIIVIGLISFIILILSIVTTVQITGVFDQLTA